MSDQRDQQGARRTVAQQSEDGRREYLGEQRLADKAQAREARIGEWVAAAAAAVRERVAVIVRTEASIGDALCELVEDYHAPLREAAKRCEVSIKGAAQTRREATARSLVAPKPERPSLFAAMESLSAQEGREKLDYAAVLKSSREDALILGVPGGSPEANAQRSHLAHDILREWTECSDRAYRAATWPSEPEVPEPFGVRKLAAAEGNVRAVVEDPDFEGDVLVDMGCGHHHELVSDEDGPHYVFVEPTAADLLEASREAGRIRGALAVRGVLSATTDAATTAMRSTIGRYAASSRAGREARHRLHTDPGRPGPSHSPF